MDRLYQIELVRNKKILIHAILNKEFWIWEIFYNFTFTFKNRKIFFAFLHVLWPPDSEKPKKNCHFKVRMSRHKLLNISRSPNARALILVPKHFYIWGIDAIKIVSELVGVFWSYPHFSLFWNFAKFHFFGIISRTLWDTLVYPGTKKFPLMSWKLLMKFLTPTPSFNNGGVR